MSLRFTAGENLFSYSSSSGHLDGLFGAGNLFVKPDHDYSTIKDTLPSNDADFISFHESFLKDYAGPSSAKFLRTDFSTENELVFAYNLYQEQLDENINTIREFAKEYSTFNNEHSSFDTLFHASLAIAATESLVRQTDYEGKIISSVDDAKGVFQFLPIGIRQGNQEHEFHGRFHDGYEHVPLLDVESSLQPTDEGAKQNIRSGVFCLKESLEFFEGDVSFTAAKHNAGITKLDKLINRYGPDYKALRADLPRETRSYVDTVSMYMTMLDTSSSLHSFKEHLSRKLSWNLIYRTINDMSRASTPEQKVALQESIINFGKYLMDEHPAIACEKTSYLTRMYSYMIGRDQLAEGNESKGMDNLMYAYMNSPSHSSIRSNTDYLLSRLD
ncbi:MAG: hypothetical protein ACQESE_04245 [Nanobdellota archaeon]